MTQIGSHELRIERTYPADLATVRRALTDPERVAKWFAPAPMHAVVHAFDLRVGGQYEISMVGDKSTHTGTGVFEDIGERRISMTFNWSEEPLPNETRLIYELEEVADGTRLTLIHTGFPNQEVADMHTSGWEGCLAQLPKAL